jgi:hypothetical protein
MSNGYVPQPMHYGIFFTPRNWYWLATNGSIYSSASQTLVPSTDATYTAWLAEHTPSPWPVDGTGAQTTASLQSVLSPYGLTAVGP